MTDTWKWAGACPNCGTFDHEAPEGWYEVDDKQVDDSGTPVLHCGCYYDQPPPDTVKYHVSFDSENTEGPTDEPFDAEVIEENAYSVGLAKLHHSQLIFLLSLAMITVAVAGIRGGKTHAGAFKTLLYAVMHPCALDEMHLVCSPTYQMSKVPVEKLFKLLYDKTVFPVCPLIKFVKSERMFILAAVGGGISRIKVVSLHDPNKIRGIKALSAWIDEGAYVTADAWDVVQGRVSDSDGPIWITTTPAGYNFIYDLYEKAVEERDAGIALDARSIRFVHWKSTANTFVKASGFERLAENFDARTHAQEIEAKFIKTSGLVYHCFNKTRNMRPMKLNPNLPVKIGQDFNVGMMASSISQPIRNRYGLPGLHIVKERMAPDSDTARLGVWLEAFIAQERIPRRNVTIYPDASGKSRSTTGKSDHQILREQKWNVVTRLKNPFIKDRVNCVNGLLDPIKSVSLEPRLFVDPSCVHHKESFEKQVYKKDSDPPEPDKEHGFDHVMDANGYSCWMQFPLRAVASLGRTTAQIRQAA